MDYVKYEMGNYNLYFIKTKKFKTITISLNFRKEITPKDEVYSTLLKNVLMYATNRYHNLDDLCRASMEVYDPSVKIGYTRSGLDQSLYLDSTFASEKYTEKGMNAKTLKFIFDYIWNPYANNGEFNQKVFDICQHEYVNDMRSIKDNPDRYTRERVWEEMEVFPFEEFNALECAEFAEKMTAKDLYNYYLTLFTDNSLDIFVTGDFDEDEMKNIIGKLVIGDFKESHQSRFIIQEARKEREIKEKADTSQSKLAIGLRFTDLTEFEHKYVSLAYNNILGGGWNSKLNKVVREKNSLCYYVYANRRMPFGISFIFSGIDAGDYEKALKLIKEEIARMSTDVTEDELKEVKDLYNNALTDIEDKQISISENVISQVLAGTDTVQKRRENMEKVTVDDVKQIAKKVHIDTIYLLEGGKASGKENL